MVAEGGVFDEPHVYVLAQVADTSVDDADPATRGSANFGQNRREVDFGVRKLVLNAVEAVRDFTDDTWDVLFRDVVGAIMQYQVLNMRGLC